MQYTFVEFFAGKGNVSAMFRKDPAHVVASFERDYSRSMDFMSPAGLALLERYIYATFEVSGNLGNSSNCCKKLFDLGWRLS